MSDSYLLAEPEAAVWYTLFLVHIVALIWRDVRFLDMKVRTRSFMLQNFHFFSNLKSGLDITFLLKDINMSAFMIKLSSV